MSNEILTKLLDPLVEEPTNLTELIHEGENFMDFRNELYTWAAKWYLDSYLKHWSDYEDKGHTELELVGIFRDSHIEQLFFSNKMRECVNLLEAIGLDGYYESIEEDATMPFVHIAQHEFEKFILGHISDIVFKIQEIYAARYEAALKEAADETNESVEQEPEIPEDLKKLRDPLDTDDINIFDLMPLPVYGATTVVTTDDFVIWFAKVVVRARVGLSVRNLADRFYDRDRGVARVFCNDVTDTLKIIALFGTFPDGDRTTRSNEVARLTLESFWKSNEDKIVSEVKEITKLWLEHGLI